MKRISLTALVIAAGMALVLGQGVAHPLWALCFVVLGALLMGGLGLLGGIVAQKFDQMAAITNFIVTPLSFLSGTFYSVEALPEPFRTLSHWNPIFYLIDGARYGFAGVSVHTRLLRREAVARWGADGVVDGREIHVLRVEAHAMDEGLEV